MKVFEYLKYLLFVIACMFAGAVSCQKPVIEVEEPLVRDIVLPERLELTVGDGGSFEVVFLPEDAVDGVIDNLKSSDERVLSVSFDGLVVTYSALSAGESVVTVTVGGVTRTLDVIVKAASGGGEPVPGGPSEGGETQKVSGCLVDFINGVRTSTGTQSPASVSVTVESGNENGNYVISVSVDGGEKKTVRGVFLGQKREIALDAGLSFGRHSVRVEVTEEKDLSQPVRTEGVVWVKSPSLTGARMVMTTDLSEQPLSASNGGSLSLFPGEKGEAVVSYEPSTSVAEYSFSSVPSFVSVDASKAVSKDNTFSFPFEVKQAGEGDLVLRLVNGDEESLYKYRLKTDGVRFFPATDFSVPPASFSVPYTGEMSWIFTPEPEHCSDTEISRISSSDESILSVSRDGLKGVFKGNGVGTAQVTVVIGSVEKTFPVKVSGDVSGFTVPSNFEVEAGVTAEYVFEPIPAGADNGSIVSIVSSKPDVLEVSGSGLTGRFTGKSVGSSQVTVLIGEVRRDFTVEVWSVVRDFTVPEDFRLKIGDSREHVVVPSPAGARGASIVSLSCVPESVLDVRHEGNRIIMTGRSDGEARVNVKMGDVDKSFNVSVWGNVTGLEVPSGLNLSYGESRNVDVSVVPVDAVNASLKVSSSNQSVVTVVNVSGLRFSVKGVGNGSASLTVEVGGIMKTIPVTVSSKVTSVSVQGSRMVELGSTGFVELVAAPAGSYDAVLSSLSSSDTSVLTVSGDGLRVYLYPKYVGKSVVSFKVGDVSSSFEVTVTGTVVTDVTLDGIADGAEIAYRSSLDAGLYPSPSNAFDAGDVSVTALNPDVVTVSALGGNRFRFSAVGFGTARFRAVCGRASREFSVVVPETIALKASALSVPWGGSVTVTVSGDNAGYTFSTEGAAFGGGSLAPLKVERDGDTFTFTNLLQQRASLSGSFSVRTTLSGVSSSVTLTAASPEDVDVFEVRPGLDERDRVFLDVYAKMGHGTFMSEGIILYIYSTDAESEYSDVRRDCAGYIQTLPAESQVTINGGRDVVARRLSFGWSREFNLWSISKYRIYLDEVVPGYVAGDSFGNYSDGFGIVGYVYGRTSGQVSVKKNFSL